MAENEKNILENIGEQEYKYGFTTDIETETIGRYLSSSQLFQIEAVYHYCTAGRIYFFKHQLDKC